MVKTVCPGCGKKFISAEHAKAHADIAHPMLTIEGGYPTKRKGWVTPHGFADFSYPVTYEFACEQMKTVAGTMFGKENL